ncbi:MAG: TetR/AcrR family transcriptional regulator [Gammaproteobacteria bacterium]|nr:TetR/AcrR family transcriptional regulator [Gammaproteobacteria bacterium]
MVKRMKAAERRASILVVAKVLFSDKGFHGVSVDEIARRVGVSPAVLYQHFPSKEALYEGVLDSLAAPRETYVEAALDGPDDFASVLSRITHVFISRVEEDPDYFRMELQSALEGGDIANRFFASRWQSIADYIEYTLRELAKDKKCNVVNERTAALMYQGLIREAIYNKCIFNSERYKDIELQDLVKQLLKLFLQSINYRE